MKAPIGQARKKRSKSNAQTQMGIVEKARFEERPWRRAICRRNPDFGFAESGARDAVKRLLPKQAIERQAGSGRPTPAPAEVKARNRARTT